MPKIRTSDKTQRIIGLTGGIGTGKSTVSQILETRYHLPILDADLYAHEAVDVDSEAFIQIAQRYGPSVLQPDGTLNRGRLGHIIFGDRIEKQWLESLIHPYVRQCLMSERERLANRPILVMTIPLLFEANLTDLVSEVWVVYCNPDQQLSRLMERNGFSQPEAQLRIESQMDLVEKCDRADVVIDNSGTLEQLDSQIDQAFHLQD